MTKISKKIIRNYLLRIVNAYFRESYVENDRFLHQQFCESLFVIDSSMIIGNQSYHYVVYLAKC